MYDNNNFRCSGVLLFFLLACFLPPLPHTPPMCVISRVCRSFTYDLTVSELYGEEDGTIQATFQVVYMIGWAPHESQPQPKRRGSGQVSREFIRGATLRLVIFNYFWEVLRGFFFSRLLMPSADCPLVAVRPARSRPFGGGGSCSCVFVFLTHRDPSRICALIRAPFLL